MRYFLIDELLLVEAAPNPYLSTHGSEITFVECPA